MHCGPTFPTIVGDDCVVGHLAHLEGCTLENGCLVGSGSVVLHYAVIESGATVGANAVVGNRKRVPADALAVGVPAIIKEGASSREVIEYSAQSYVENGRRFSNEMRQLD